MRTALLALLLLQLAQAADTYLLEAETLELKGDWQITGEGSAARAFLHAGGSPIQRPAVGAITIPTAGRYRLWARSKDYARDRPGIRNYTIRLGNKRSDTRFGTHAKEGIGGWEWEDGGLFELPAGPLLVVVGEDGKPSSRCDALILTKDLAYQPKGLPANLKLPAPAKAKLEVESQSAKAKAAAQVENVSATPIATLQNKEVRFDFHTAVADGKPVIILRIPGVTNWGESYRILYRPKDKPANLVSREVNPRWDAIYAPPARVSAGGASVITTLGSPTDPNSAAIVTSLRPNAIRTVAPGTLELAFPPADAGQLTAIWHLPADAPAADITLRFTPAKPGQYSLAYYAPLADAPAKLDFVLLPFMYHGRRIPAERATILDARTPTPIALVNQNGKSVALLADPRDLPDGWPSAPSARYAFGLRNDHAEAQPIIYSPVLGGIGSAAEPNHPIQSRLSLWVQSGPWHEAFERIVQQRFGLRDYRRPLYGSLSDAALNLTDLIKSGWAWDDRAKGPWNIEARNIVTQSSPLLYMSLYLLTGDEELYRRYALPSLEFLLSRQTPHFAAVEPFGPNYYSGEPLAAPGNHHSATLWASAYAMTAGRTPVFGELTRLPDGQPRTVRGNGHLQPFEDLLALYRLTGDKRWLSQAVEAADKYIDQNLRQLPTKDLGPQPFVNVSFVPDWEGLLHLYEATGERRFLDASAEGARWLLTTLWVHPAVKDADMTVYPGNVFDGERHLWYFGDKLFRQGLYEKDDASIAYRGSVDPARIPEAKVPAWQVSNVGLGIEQPVTFSQPKADNQIMMSIWAPNLLRLAQLTGDTLFRTAARNATIGRFTNYPGYYLNGYSNIQQKPDYPRVGPDVTSLYYHHIPSFAAYVIDYLFTDAEMRSKGAVIFPTTRQDGYVWFDSRLYGHAPGKIYGESAWPMLSRTAATVDNINVDRILAHGDNKFYVVLLNQTNEPQTVKVGFGVKGSSTLRIWKDNAPAAPVREGDPVTLTPGGIVVLARDGAAIDIRTQRTAPPAQLPLPQTNTLVQKGDAFGTLITAPPFDTRDLYVFVTSKQCKSARLTYRVGKGPEQTATVDRYPCEFTVPLKDTTSPVDWRVEALP